MSNLVTGSAVLCPKNSPGIWTAFLEAVFTGSGPVFNNCFLYFLANDKKFFGLNNLIKLSIICFPKH